MKSMSTTKPEPLVSYLGATDWWSEGRLINRETLEGLANRNTELRRAVYGRTVMIGPGADLEKLAAFMLVDGVAGATYWPDDALPQDVLEQHIDTLGVSFEISSRPRSQLPSATVSFDGELATNPDEAESFDTRWILTTSGTTNIPKAVIHRREELLNRIHQSRRAASLAWGLMYDPARFAGLQVVLHAVLNGSPLVLPDRTSPLAQQISQMSRAGVTALSATPTQWRRLLMAGIDDIPLEQVTLGGEMVDQATLTAIRNAFPTAVITHIYASTEAGVGFSVHDGREGFAANLVDGVKIDVRQGRLFVHCGCPAEYPTSSLADDAGWIDTGDDVELRNGRYRFLGRSSGVINVGGQKVHPEEVEQVILSAAGVIATRVTGFRNSIVGELVQAELEMKPNAERTSVLAEVRRVCQATLPKYKVPTRFRVVESLAENAAGKIVRSSNA